MIDNTYTKNNCYIHCAFYLMASILNHGSSKRPGLR